MKIRTKVLSALLAAVLAAACALPALAAPAAAERHVELEDAGEFESNNIRIMRNALLEPASNNSAYICDSKGQHIADDDIVSVEYLEGGLYEIIKDGGEEVNSASLVSEDGKVLIPFECAFYKWPNDSINGSKVIQNRFIIAYTGTEVTENQEEALFYTSESFVTLAPGKDDVLYKGYARIFDTQENKFVGDIKLERLDKYESVHIVGNSILLQNDDKTYTLYDAAGKKLRDFNSRTECSPSAILEKAQSGSGFTIYDDAGKELYSGEGSCSVFKSTSGYFQVYEDGGYKIIDSSGKQVLSEKVDVIYEEDHDLFRVSKDNVKQIMDASGKVLAETEGTIMNTDAGIFEVESGVKEYTLVGPGGVIADKAKEPRSDIYTVDNSIIAYNDGSAYLTYDDNASYTVFNGSVLYVDPRNDSAPALYDMYTGKKLLDDGFTNASKVGSRIVLEYDSDAGTRYKTLAIEVK